MTARFSLTGALLGLFLCVPVLRGVPAAGQILPRDAALPVQVKNPKGDFARKLDGAVLPTGKGWKAAMDREKLLQIMLPETWKVIPDEDGDALLRVVPPGSEKTPRAVLLVMLAAPRDADPLEVEESFAASYAENLARHPDLARLRFQPTDSGFVLARGLRFALAGGTMVTSKKQAYRQQQLIYIGEDRIVTLQFTVEEKEFPRYAEDLARIFASYQNLGVRKAAE